MATGEIDLMDMNIRPYNARTDFNVHEDKVKESFHLFLPTGETYADIFPSFVSDNSVLFNILYLFCCSLL